MILTRCTMEESLFENFQNYEVLLGSDYLIYNDGETLLLGELGESCTKHSRGLYWSNRQSSIAAHSVVTWISPRREGNGRSSLVMTAYRPRKCGKPLGFVSDTAIEMSKIR